MKDQLVITVMLVVPFTSVIGWMLFLVLGEYFSKATGRNSKVITKSYRDKVDEQHVKKVAALRRAYAESNTPAEHIIEQARNRVAIKVNSINK